MGAPPQSADDDARRDRLAAVAELIDALREVGSPAVLETGSVLCREGDASDEAFVVVSGRLDARVQGFGGDMLVSSHGPGSLVGEVTTLVGGRRTATLIASEPTTIHTVDRESLRDVFARLPAGAEVVRATARDRTDRTRAAALLSRELEAVDGAAVAEIAARVTWTNLAAGDELFHRDDVADAAYLVTSGRLGVRDLDGPVERGIEVGRGGIVGEFGLLEDRRRSATVFALRDTSLARLDAEDFRELSSDHTQLAMGLVRRILGRSGVEHVDDRRNRSFTFATTVDIDAGQRARLVGRMVDALQQLGSTVLLDPAVVDRRLGQDGASGTAPGALGEVRLAEMFHQIESDVDHAVIDAGHHARSGADSGIGVDEGERFWTARALHHADQVIVFCSAQPGPDELEAIRTVLRGVPDGISCWLALTHRWKPERAPQASPALRALDVDEIHHVALGEEPTVARLARLAAGRGVGLVLSGGGARGYAHIGVHRALVEAGVPVDRVVGASMGSIVAGGIGLDIGNEEMRERIAAKGRRLLDYTVPVVSLVKGRRIVDVLDSGFHDCSFDQLWVKFACVSTDLTTAELVVHRDGPITPAIRASIAIPGVLPPVVRDGHLLADGGVLDNLPVGVLADDRSIGTIIASDVAPPVGPRASMDYGLSVSGWSVLSSRFRRDRPAVRYPGVATTLMRSLLIGSSQSRDQHLASGVVDLHLEIDAREIALFDFADVERAAELGYEASRAAIGEWVDAR